MEEVAARGARYGVSLTGETPPCLLFEGIRFWRYAPVFHDAELRLAQMDAAGVDCQVLTLGPPMVYWADPELGLALCRIFNDEIAKLVRRHPDRFIGFAVLPLQDTARALAELDRAMSDLGLAGVGIGSNVHGVQLDDARLAPFWERVAALDVPIFVHPINPAAHGNIHDYRMDLSVGFPFETTIAAARLVYAGILDRHANLRVCLAHLGGALPVLRERLNIGFRVGRDHFGASFGITESPEVYLEKLYFDILSYDEPALLAGLACVGPERLVLGSDAPFAVGDLGRSVASVRDFAFLPRRDRARILGDNARRVLGRAP